jgi:hypothetical protein
LSPPASFSISASRLVWSCSSCCSAAAGSRCGCVCRICERNCPAGDSIRSGAIGEDGGSDSEGDGDEETLTTLLRLLAVSCCRPRPCRQQPGHGSASENRRIHFHAQTNRENKQTEKKSGNGLAAYREVKHKIQTNFLLDTSIYSGQEPEARPYLDGAEREAPPAVEEERARARRRRPPRGCGGGRGRPERRGRCCLHGLIRSLDGTNRIREFGCWNWGSFSRWLVGDRESDDEVKGMREVFGAPVI